MTADELKNAKIRVTRATSNKISSTYTANPAGHPIFDTQKNYLYIGDGNNQVAALKPITTNRIEHTNYSITNNGTNTIINSKQSIKFNLNSNNIFNVTNNGIEIASDKNFVGNASTATKLQNIRKINGIPFDGSGDVSLTSGQSWNIVNENEGAKGWYHFLDVDMKKIDPSSNGNNTNAYLLLSLNSCYSSYKTGILAVNIRYNTDTAGYFSTSTAYWMSRSGWEEDAVKIILDEENRIASFYILNTAVNRWMGINITVLSSSSRINYYVNGIDVRYDIQLDIPSSLSFTTPTYASDSFPTTESLGEMWEIVISQDESTVMTASYYKTFNSTLTETQAENVTIKPFTYYKVSGSTYNISLTLESANKADVMDEYLFEFSTSVGQSLTLTLPDDVSYANDWTVDDFEQGKTYLLYIINKKVFVSSL